MSNQDPVGEALVDELEERIRAQGQAGLVQVITPVRAHWRIVPDAPWTALSYDRRTGELRFRLKGRDFRSKEQARKTAELTLHALLQMRDLCLQMAENFHAVVERSGLEYEHISGADFRPPGGK